MPVKGLSAEEIAAATAAVVAAGGKSTDRANRLPGETATEANARITAGYRNQAIPELTQEGKAAGATMEFVRTGAGGVGTYKEIYPIGTPIPTERNTAYGNVYDAQGNLISGTGKKTGGVTGPAGPTAPKGPTSPTGPTQTSPAGPTGTGPTGTGPTGTGPTTSDFVAPEDLPGPSEAALIAGEKKAQRQSAYDLLYTQFKLYGLEALVEPLQKLIVSGVSPDQFTIELRASKPYQDRFAANAKRIANGFAAIDEATYLDLEDKYQSVMQNYGLPASYYEKGTLGVQKGFEDLIGGNVDPVTLEERVIEGQRLLKGVKQTTDAAKEFYPELTDGDFLAYVLNPKNALTDIRRKITAAEIGGAQLGAGLKATAAGAEQLVAAGVTGQGYQKAAPTIAETATRGSQLAAMYGESPYTQTTAEQAILNVPGSAEAVKQTKKLTALEQAEFAKKSGVGILSRERAGAI